MGSPIICYLSLTSDQPSQSMSGRIALVTEFMWHMNMMAFLRQVLWGNVEMIVSAILIDFARKTKKNLRNAGAGCFGCTKPGQK